MEREVRLVASQLYIHQVKQRSQATSFTALEKRLKRSNLSSISGSILRYARKERPVKDARLVRDIENSYPGTKRVLYHPLWFILDEPFAGLDTIHDQMRMLNLDIQGQLFQKNHETNFYERKKWPYWQSFYKIDMVNDLDALACFLMLINEMESMEKWFGFTKTKWFALGVFLRLSHFYPFSVIADDLYELIHYSFIDRNNSSASECRIHFTDETYSAPTFLHKDKRQLINDKISSILFKAQNQGFDIPDKQSQFRFLSWVFIYGLEKTHKAFNTHRPDIEDQQLINKLLSTYQSKNLRRDIPRYHAHAIFNPRYEH